MFILEFRNRIKRIKIQSNYSIDGLEVSIASYHQIKCIKIIYLRIEVVHQNIYLRIDIYIFVSKLINHILFFFITGYWNIRLSSTSY